jgi:DNA-binding MarR family transcriptional regulator
VWWLPRGHDSRCSTPIPLRDVWRFLMQRENLRNTAKLRALESLVDKGWQRVRDWANAARLRPTRRAYTYALRLERYRLVERARGRDGRVWLRITARGSRRLAWLNREQRGQIQGLLSWLR